MQELIKLETKKIGNEEVNAVDARELHIFLQSRQDFSTWIKNRIEQYGFSQGIDFVQFHNFVESDARPRVEYTISLDMAKELSMVERTAKGKEARQYFILCEKIANKDTTLKAVNLHEIANHLESSIKIASLLGLDKNQSIHSANTMVKRISGVDCMREFGVLAIEYKENIQYLTPSVLGDMSGISAVKMNKILEEKGLQYETRDHRNKLVWVITPKGKEYSRLFDTKKLKSDGTSIMQVKWAESVLSI